MSDAEKEGFRTGGIQERRDAGEEGYSLRGMQDRRYTYRTCGGADDFCRGGGGLDHGGYKYIVNRKERKILKRKGIFIVSRNEAKEAKRRFLFRIVSLRTEEKRSKNGAP